MGHIYLEIIQVISAYGCRRNFSLFYLQVVDKVENALGSRVAIGQTKSGRFLRVIYVPDSEPNSVFIITAYVLKGKPLIAYRKRRRRKK